MLPYLALSFFALLSPLSVHFANAAIITSTTSATITSKPIHIEHLPEIAAPSKKTGTLTGTVVHKATTTIQATPKTSVPTTVNAPVVLDETSQLESLVLQYENAARAANDVAPLTADTSLARIARGHSADMLQNNYFSHTNLSGCDGACRMTAAGYLWQKMGENIHMMGGYTLNPSDTAHKIVNDWMNSPEHRANLLNPAFTIAGVGIALSGSTIYSTTDYALPR